MFEACDGKHEDYVGAVELIELVEVQRDAHEKPVVHALAH